MKKIQVCLVYQCTVEIEVGANESIDDAARRAEWSDVDKFQLTELTTVSEIED